MARTSYDFGFLLALLFAFLSVGLALQMPDPHRYVPHSFLKVDTTRLDQWRPALDAAAADAVRVINSHRPLDRHLALDQVQTDGVQVGRALAFSGTIELADHHQSRPSHYTFTQHSDFIHLQPVQPLAPLWALPSPSASLKTEPANQLPQPDEAPAFPEVELEGPLVLHLDQQLYDPVLRLPHSVEVGAVQVIRVGPGVRLRLGGVIQMRLRSSLDVQRNFKLLALMDENNATTANSHQHHQREMDVPELELKLVDQGRAFRMWSSSAERVKAKRRSAHVLELLATPPSPAADVSSQVTTTSDRSTDLAARTESPWVLSQANLLRGVMSAFAQADEEKSVVLRRVVEAKAEAVNVLVIPMTLREHPHNNLGGGETSEWQVVVTRGVDGRHTVVSHQQLVEQESHVTVAPWVWANTTVPAIMRTVQLLEKEAHRPAQASS